MPVKISLSICIALTSLLINQWLLVHGRTVAERDNKGSSHIQKTVQTPKPQQQSCHIRLIDAITTECRRNNLMFYSSESVPGESEKKILLLHSIGLSF